MLIGAGTQLWTDPSAILTAQTEIFLSQDGTYSALYREFDFNNEVFSKKIESTFRLNGETQEVEFSGLGVGKVVTSARGRRYIQLRYDQDQHAPLLKGNTGNLILYRSVRGLNTDRNEQCGF